MPVERTTGMGRDGEQPSSETRDYVRFLDVREVEQGQLLGVTSRWFDRTYLA